MAQTLLKPTIIAKWNLEFLKNNCVMPRLVNTELTEHYRKIGETVTVRKPMQYKTHEGRDVTGSIHQIYERSSTVVINHQKNVTVALSAWDMTLTFEQIMEKFFKPAASELINDVDLALAELYKKVYNAAGTAADTIDSWADLADLGARMDVLGIPSKDRRLVLSPIDYWDLTSAIVNYFVTKRSELALIDGYLGSLAGFDIFKDQNIFTHTVAGTQTAVTLDSTLTKNSTLNQIVVTGLDANLIVGDIFTIAGVYEVNPKSRASTGNLQKHVVTSAVSFTGTSDTITFSPTIVMSDDSTYPEYQNVNAYPVAGAAVVFTGTHKANLAFMKDAFNCVCVPLLPVPGVKGHTEVDKETGLALRVEEFGEPLTDVFGYRMDIMYGVDCKFPELAFRVLG